MAVAVDIATNEVSIAVEQTQTISRATPAFRLPMEVWFRFADGSERVEAIEISERLQTFAWSFDETVTAAAPNPRAGALAKIDWKASSALLRATALEGPTLYARLIAVAGFENVGAEQVGIDGLRAVLASDAVPYRARVEAARVLGRMSDARARDVLIAWLGAEKVRMALESSARTITAREAGFARIRTATYESLAAYRGDEVMATFGAAAAGALADGEPSYYAEAAIAAGLAKVAFVGNWETISALAERASWSDEMRKRVLAAIRAVNDVRESEFAAAMAWTETVAEFGNPDRTRPEALRTLVAMGAKLPRHERGGLLDRLVAWTTDPMERTRSTAIAQIAVLDAPGSRGALTALAASSDPDVAETAQSALDGMAGSFPLAEELAALKVEVDFLRKEREGIESLRAKLESMTAMDDEAQSDDPDSTAPADE
jgi:hypothetical protein